jgi:chemotaxis regulatin CheY-phosphate phosphatase CheZ
MRKIKTLKIEGFREVTVKELRTRDYRDLVSRAQSLDSLGQAIELLTLLSDLAAEEIEDLAPSEIKQVLDLIQEVNADFLSGVAWAGITKEKLRQALADTVQAFLSRSSILLSAPLSSAGTSTPGITA